MSILGLFGVILFICLLVWLITSFTPIPVALKNAVIVVGIILVFLVVLSAIGVLGAINIRVPQVN